MYRKKGFTLIELIVVIVIIAILSSIALVVYKHFMERMRIGEADSLIGTVLLGQERYYLKTQRYTQYWHHLDAVPVAVRTPRADNNFANGLTNTIYYTRGGAQDETPRAGFAIHFEKDLTDKWFAVARRVGPGDFTYQLVRPFDSTRTFCVPDMDNEDDVKICLEYMGLENPSELPGDPRLTPADVQAFSYL